MWNLKHAMSFLMRWERENLKTTPLLFRLPLAFAPLGNKRHHHHHLAFCSLGFSSDEIMSMVLYKNVRFSDI
jgi:hypothetical protein